MKGKLLSLCLVGFVGILMISCKNEVEQLSGEYSYKISGSVVVDSVEARLNNENGVLRIIAKDKSDALLTFNMLGGDVYTTTAAISNKVMELTPFERIIVHNAKDYKISVSGQGDVVDENIILSLQYNGMSMDEDSVSLETKEIHFVGTKNK